MTGQTSLTDIAEQQTSQNNNTNTGNKFVIYVDSPRESKFRKQANNALKPVIENKHTRKKVIDSILNGESDHPRQFTTGRMYWHCMDAPKGVAVFSLGDDPPTNPAIEHAVNTREIGYFLTPELPGKDMDDLHDKLTRLLENGVDIRLTETGTRIRSEHAETVSGVLQSITDSAEEIAARKIAGERADAGSDDELHRGRPRLGYTVENGELVRGEDYTEVRGTLRAVIEGVKSDGDAGISKRKAAKKLDCSPRTITRAIRENSAAYDL